MTTRADLRNAVLALQGQVPESMHLSRGAIDYVLTCAQFAQPDESGEFGGPVSGDDPVVLTLLSHVVKLESDIERAAGRQYVPDQARLALFTEFIV